MVYKEFTVSSSLVSKYFHECLGGYRGYWEVADCLLKSNINFIESLTYWDITYDYSVENCFHGYLCDKLLRKQAYEWATEKISQFLRSNPDNAFISFELILTYQEAKLIETNVIPVGEQDCGYILRDGCSEEQFYNLMDKGADGHFSIGGCFEDMSYLTQDKHRANLRVQDLFNRLSYLLIGAYDEEGFIFSKVKISKQ